MMIVYSSPFEESKNINISIYDNMTVADLVKLVGDPYGKLDQYYPLSGHYYESGCNVLPFVITSKGVVFDAKYEEITIADFVKTHDIEDEIRVVYGGAHAGGPGWDSLLQIWTNFMQSISMVKPFYDTVLGVGDVLDKLGGIYFGCAIIKAIKNICIGKYKATPHQSFEFITSRDKWTTKELVTIMNLDTNDKKHIKYLLKAFGYKWDPHEQVYIKTEITSVIENKLRNVSYYYDNINVM